MSIFELRVFLPLYSRRPTREVNGQSMLTARLVRYTGPHPRSWLDKNKWVLEPWSSRVFAITAYDVLGSTSVDNRGKRCRPALSNLKAGLDLSDRWSVRFKPSAMEAAWEGRLRRHSRRQYRKPRAKAFSVWQNLRPSNTRQDLDRGQGRPVSLGRTRHDAGC